MQSLKQFFEYLNDINFKYVVLRNFENLPAGVEVGSHGDLDLLVYDLEHFKEVFPQVIAEFPSPRVRYKLLINNVYVYMDLRSVGDGYYPEQFQKDILENREYNQNGFFTPDPMRFRIALAYHAVHHKNFNNYQRWLGDATIEQLLEALKGSTIGWEEPQDKSVGRFNPYWKGATAIVSKDDLGVNKKQVGYRNFDLLNNEATILKLCDSIHFPKVLSVDEDSITIEDCGEILNAENIPDNWKTQLKEILDDLKMFKIIHRDIKPDNLMVKNGIIKLIDFGWAIQEGHLDSPPSCLGFPYKPSWGFSDDFSMRKVAKEFTERIEEKICV